jgi:threonine dehydrogenase-like Zn-dependent dehydrogenase
MEFYFDFVRSRRIDATPLITHRFPLARYDEAFLACYDQGASGAVKVLFTHPQSDT